MALAKPSTYKKKSRLRSVSVAHPSFSPTSRESLHLSPRTFLTFTLQKPSFLVLSQAAGSTYFTSTVFSHLQKPPATSLLSCSSVLQSSINVLLSFFRYRFLVRSFPRGPGRRRSHPHAYGGTSKRPPLYLFLLLSDISRPPLSAASSSVRRLPTFNPPPNPMGM